MTDLLDRLRRRGWPLTAQRRVVAEVLSGEHVHLTADEVHRAALARLPEVSRATVYNTLRELVALGEVGEIASGRARRYDPNAGHPHHHLVCDGCGTIRDVRPEFPATLPSGDDHGFRVTSVEIVYRGLCGACAGGLSRPRPAPHPGVATRADG